MVCIMSHVLCDAASLFIIDSRLVRPQSCIHGEKAPNDATRKPMWSSVGATGWSRMTQDGNNASERVCNLCGGQSFGRMRGRPFGRCNGCGSLERTRLLFALLAQLRSEWAGMRVLHFAPERSLAAALLRNCAELAMYDLDPSGYPGLPVGVFDLCADLPSLPDGSFDLVIHSHVLEHVPTDPIAVANALTEKVRPGGLHLFCVPILTGHYREDLSPALTEEDRVTQFGQGDHLRRFGRADFESRFLRHVHGARVHNPIDVADPDTLRRLSVPEPTWAGLSGNTILSVDVPA